MPVSKETKRSSQPQEEKLEILIKTEDEFTIMNVVSYNLPKQLLERGAKKVLANAELNDFYFDTEDEHFENVGLRMRIRSVKEIGKKVWFRVDIKNNHEKISFVDNIVGKRTIHYKTYPEAFKGLEEEIKILKQTRKGRIFKEVAIKLKDLKVRSRKKYRTSYKLYGVKFDFDTFIEESIGWCKMKKGKLELGKECDIKELASIMNTFLEAEILFDKGSPEEEKLKKERAELLKEFGVPEREWRNEEFSRIAWSEEN